MADSGSAATHSRQVHAYPETAFISGSFLLPLSEAFRQDSKDTDHSPGEELGEAKGLQPGRCRVAALTVVKVAGPLAPGKNHDGYRLGHHLRVEPNGARFRVDTIAARREGTMRRSALVTQARLIRKGPPRRRYPSAERPRRCDHHRRSRKAGLLRSAQIQLGQSDQLTALGNQLRASQQLRRSPIAPSAQPRQIRRGILVSSG